MSLKSGYDIPQYHNTQVNNHTISIIMYIIPKTLANVNISLSILYT